MDEIRLSSESFHRDLAEVHEWLAIRGFSKFDRFRHYKSAIEKLSALERTRSAEEIYRIGEGSGSASETFSAFFEGGEFVRVLRTLISKQVEIPDEVVRRALEGPWDAALEDQHSSLGRNAAFELVMAAVVAQQDLHPRLGTSNPDVEFVFHSHRVMMECKRIFSAKRLLDNVADSIGQLGRCVQIDRGEIGLVAVSVSRLAHEGNGYFEMKSEREANAFLHSGLQRMISDFERELMSLSRPCVAGVIFHVSCPFYIQEKGFTPLSAGMVFPGDQSLRSFMGELSDVLRV